MQSRSFGQYALCLLLILGGLVCLAITAGSNLDVAVSLASTMGGKVFYGAGALVVDVVGVALFACVVGHLFRNHRYLAGAGMTVIVTCFMAFSMVTFYGFGVKERLSKTELAEKQHDAQMSADAATQARKDAVRNRLLDDLQMEAESASAILMAKQAATDKSSIKSELQAIRDRKSSVAFSDIEVKATPVMVDPDPMARAISYDTGFSVTQVQKILTLGLGILLILAKALAFGFGFALWPKAESKPVPDVAVEEEAEDIAADNDPEPKALIHTPKLAVDAARQVEEFYRDATIPTPNARPLQAGTLHAYYEQWVEEKNYWPCLTLNSFGRESARLVRDNKIDMERKLTTTGVMYHGRTPIQYDARRVG